MSSFLQHPEFLGQFYDTDDSALSTESLIYKHALSHLSKVFKKSIPSNEVLEELLNIFRDRNFFAKSELEQHIWQMTAAIVYCYDGQYEKSLEYLQRHRMINNSDVAMLSVQCLLHLNRCDLARKIAQQADDTVSGLLQAWIALASNIELNEAFFIYQEYIDMQKSTNSIYLNGQAICQLGQGLYAEAEDLLRQAMAMKTDDYDTLINMNVLTHLTGKWKGTEMYSNVWKRLQEVYPDSDAVQDFERHSALFDTLCENWRNIKK